MRAQTEASRLKRPERSANGGRDARARQPGRRVNPAAAPQTSAGRGSRAPALRNGPATLRGAGLREGSIPRPGPRGGTEPRSPRGAGLREGGKAHFYLRHQRHQRLLHRARADLQPRVRPQPRRGRRGDAAAAARGRGHGGSLRLPAIAPRSLSAKLRSRRPPARSRRPPSAAAPPPAAPLPRPPGLTLGAPPPRPAAPSPPPGTGFKEAAPAPRPLPRPAGPAAPLVPPIRGRQPPVGTEPCLAAGGTGCRGSRCGCGDPEGFGVYFPTAPAVTGDVLSVGWSQRAAAVWILLNTAFMLKQLLWVADQHDAGRSTFKGIKVLLLTFFFPTLVLEWAKLTSQH